MNNDDDILDPYDFDDNNDDNNDDDNDDDNY